MCKECKGSALCQHGREKRRCHECGGSAVCEHGRESRHCKDCGGTPRVRIRCQPTCVDCGLWQVTKRGGRCQYCNLKSVRRSMYDKRRAEQQVNTHLAQALDSSFVVYPVGTYAPFSACGDDRKPDTVVRKDDFMGLIETDENGHRSSRYTTTCEWAKALGHAQSGLQTEGVKRIGFFRINPDAWMVDGRKKECPLVDRMELLTTKIEEAAKNQTKAFSMTILYFPSPLDNPVQEVAQDVIDDWMDELAG
ncbi:hypothetical protein DFS34DRAFT_433855 [Phlyctochytrium arcticum]|nr:hypothetical protein DFS34DRAFT_433855 [Phlyctochytrium arcticum]